jgi:hypothetical protein
MDSLYPVSCSFLAFTAGDNDVSAVHPHPHIPARNKVGITMVAELPAVFAVDPAPLAHRDPAGKFHVPVGKFRTFCIHLLCLPEQYGDALPCDLFYLGFLRFIFQYLSPSPGCRYYCCAR